VQRLDEGAAREVLARDDLEADLTQRLGHGARIVDRIAQRVGVLIGAVADHQRHARLRLRPCGGGAQADQRDEQESQTRHVRNPQAS